MFLSTTWGSTRFLVLDAETNELIRYPQLADGWRLEGESLSADGSLIVYKAVGEEGTSRALVVQTIATGQQEIIDAIWDGTAGAGATLSPDNTTLGLMSSIGLDKTSRLTLLDLDSNQRRVLWTTKDQPSDGNTVSWSPSGRMIAVNCFASRRNKAHVAVIDVNTGEEIRIIDKATTLRAPNGTWIADDVLLIEDWSRPWKPEIDGQWLAINVLTGESQKYNWQPKSTKDLWLAYLDGEVICSTYDSAGGSFGEYQYFCAPLGSSEDRLFLTLTPPEAGIRVIDVAPLATTGA